MATITVTFDAPRFTARLQTFLVKATEGAERIAQEVAADVLNDTRATWPVDSGESRAAWEGPQKVGEPHTRLGIV